MSPDLKDAVLDEELEKIAGRLDGKRDTRFKKDYYQYLTYKIENGKVSEVLP
ncbi:hypothetical protein [Chryseobacterium gleum]|uniref:hypothetical protein n=1 Tax=Chryseobacterium gleum TaxID=250 RepID=UPI002898018E|nr:hypothetical protein [Chryseobacterium gleum]